MPDYYFIDKSFFFTYTSMNYLTIDLFAEKDLTFEILDKSTIILKTLINSVTTTIIFNNILHTPSLSIV